MKIKLESWNSAQVSTCVYMKIPVNFFYISCHQLSTAVNSWWQLLTADENENQARELKFGTSINFSVYIKIPVEFFSYQLSLAVNSWWQLITDDENEKHPKELIFGISLHFSLYMKIPVDFFSYQLLSDVDSCKQLVTAESIWSQQKSA